MTTETYETECWGETYRIRANFADAASPVQVEDEDGNLYSTQWQVADFRHDPKAAMRAILKQDDVDDECDDDIAAAVEAME